MSLKEEMEKIVEEKFGDPAPAPKTPETQPSVTVKDLDDLVEQMFAKRREIEEIEAHASAKNKELAELQGKAVAYLKELGRDSYKTPNGTIHIIQKWRVNVPKSDEDKKAFFDWLNDRGIFLAYASINSNSLNSLYMAEWEKAQVEGRGMEFSMPGIGEPKLFETIGMRKR